jgi:hypothetical protein
LSNFNIEYKIAPPASVSIIGSNSIDTAGDLYVVNVNAITKENNKRNKRLFDMALACLLLIFSPIVVWFVNERSNFFKNIFRVMSKKYSWVGYHYVNTAVYLSLPAIQKGILKTTDLLVDGNFDNEMIDRVNMLYARNYSVLKDFEMVWKLFKKLGQEP